MKRIAIKVIPNSNKNNVDDSGDILIVRVTAPPFEGKANLAVIAVLAKHFNVKKRAVRIVQGGKGRKKIVEIDSD